MILNAVLFGHGSHEAAWRHPAVRATAPLDLAHWTACARDAEAGGFDGLFLGDILCLQDHPDLHPSETLDPFMVLAALAAATTRLTLTGTASTSFNHPFHLARRILSLHHLSGGRAGWNIVTSSYPQEATTFGWDAMPPTDTRYEIAQEVVEAVQALWSAWDGIDRVADKDGARWLTAAPQPVRREGRFGRLDGTVNLSPAPYGRPVLAQAGSSAKGRAFAARHADQVFTVQNDRASARAFRDEVRVLAASAGRDPDALAVLPGVVPFVADTRAEAEAQLAELSELVGQQHVLTKLARFIGLDLSGDDPDAPFAHRPEDLRDNAFSNSRARLLVADAQDRGLTLRDMANRFAAGHGHLLLVGTGAEVAATLDDWIAHGAADGFNVMPPMLPGGIADFGGHVIPHLRHR
ncbi:NtaA/DmoA family FMN-dependent monooxygenase [Psychromarinibacter halotolerans]|uniref:NtaA/DmoA family FMN-dependent monooxygenase n=1 Tax=Psychromarinibacter halotolerans TaxID=1775175 RepID=A0ABV7GWR8_9RHOB|nr:NtaA/DmoA family FMN-dependent monooxygenase [Psychromarinibacter halotolerans]MDF0595282.1 NtaA/DmoA family FMN-dependent monooxygenase [Psychromarinibacter halotolerans]